LRYVLRLPASIYKRHSKNGISEIIMKKFSTRFIHMCFWCLILYRRGGRVSPHCHNWTFAHRCHIQQNETIILHLGTHLIEASARTPQATSHNAIFIEAAKSLSKNTPHLLQTTSLWDDPVIRKPQMGQRREVRRGLI